MAKKKGDQLPIFKVQDKEKVNNSNKHAKDPSFATLNPEKVASFKGTYIDAKKFLNHRVIRLTMEELKKMSKK